MTKDPLNRRALLAGAGAIVATAGLGFILPAQAQGLAATPSMRGGSNNYLPGAKIVDRIGDGGFWMTGTVRRAGDGAP
ncbi:MAG: twin-arginine translocation pathway signal, partial [Hyphomicrobiales bacterium]